MSSNVKCDPKRGKNSFCSLTVTSFHVYKRFINDLIRYDGIFHSGLKNGQIYNMGCFNKTDIRKLKTIIHRPIFLFARGKDGKKIEETLRKIIDYLAYSAKQRRPWWNKKYGKDSKCPITLSRLRPGTTFKTTCGHFINTNALAQLIMNSQKSIGSETTLDYILCPICRRELFPSKERSSQNT